MEENIFLFVRPLSKSLFYFKSAAGRLFKSEECELADGRIVNRSRTAFVTVVYVEKGLFGGGKCLISPIVLCHYTSSPFI